MQSSNELANLGVKVIRLIGDAMMYAWQLFIGQISILLATPWHTQPVIKILLVVLVVVVIVAVVWNFLEMIAHILAGIGAMLSYALATLFIVGCVAAVANWVVRTVPNSSLALN